jgi:hypothetical protein
MKKPEAPLLPPHPPPNIVKQRSVADLMKNLIVPKSHIETFR